MAPSQHMGVSISSIWRRVPTVRLNYGLSAEWTGRMLCGFLFVYSSDVLLGLV